MGLERARPLAGRQLQRGNGRLGSPAKKSPQSTTAEQLRVVGSKGSEMDRLPTAICESHRLNAHRPLQLQASAASGIGRPEWCGSSQKKNDPPRGAQDRAASWRARGGEREMARNTGSEAWQALQLRERTGVHRSQEGNRGGGDAPEGFLRNNFPHRCRKRNSHVYILKAPSSICLAATSSPT